MKRKIVWILAVSLAAAMLMTACGKEEEVVEPVEEPEVVEEVEEEEEEPEEVGPEGTYRSELTNEWIDESLKDQRPVAIMVDNEITALDHYGTADADVVYEIMNSTKNGRITRLMCVVKDWKKIEKMGSIRSIRPTNFMLAAEWNAVMIHDGGPFYIDEFMEKDWSDNLSGGFWRVNNGKAREFTEYVSNEDKDGYKGITSRMKKAGISETYNQYYPGTHYLFAKGERDLSEEKNAFDATEVNLPFKHTSSALKYNEETGTYDFYDYGEIHKDAETGAVLTFKNVLIQNCDFTLQDGNGYIIYNTIVSDWDGYYLTNGKAIPVKWSKSGETEVTHYYDLDGNEIELNTGKTYITMVPADSWSDLSIK